MSRYFVIAVDELCDVYDLGDGYIRDLGGLLISIDGNLIRDMEDQLSTCMNTDAAS
jgi:hypothetical protein